MKFFTKRYDGGENSGVTGYWLVEIKSLFSVVLLKFEPNRRENYHSHAFNALTWFLKGDLVEERIYGKDDILGEFYEYKRNLIPKMTKRNNVHKVHAKKTSWCLSIRGPWHKTWREYNPKTQQWITLTNGRKVVD